MPHPVNLLGSGAKNQAERVVAKEELAAERTELPARLVESEARDGTTHLDVGKADRGRHEFGHAAAFDRHTGITVRLHGFLEVLGEGIPVVTRGVAKEATGLQVLERAGAIPRPLALDDEHFALGISRNACWAAQATADGNHLAGGGDLDGPAAEEVVGIIGTAEAQRDPHIAFGVRLGGEGKFMAFRVAPVIRERLITISHAITVEITDAHDLAEGRRQHRAIAPRQGKDFVLPRCEEVVGRLGRRSERPVDEVDVPAACAHGEASVRENFQATWTHGYRRGDGDIHDGIIFCLLDSGSPHGAEVLGESQRGEGEGRKGEAVTARYHWYSRMRVEVPAGRFSGRRSSPSRTWPDCVPSTRTVNLSAW